MLALVLVFCLVTCPAPSASAAEAVTYVDLTPVSGNTGTVSSNGPSSCLLNVPSWLDATVNEIIVVGEFINCVPSFYTSEALMSTLLVKSGNYCVYKLKVLPTEVVKYQWIYFHGSGGSYNVQAVYCEYPYLAGTHNAVTYFGYFDGTPGYFPHAGHSDVTLPYSSDYCPYVEFCVPEGVLAGVSNITINFSWAPIGDRPIPTPFVYCKGKLIDFTFIVQQYGTGTLSINGPFDDLLYIRFETLDQSITMQPYMLTWALMLDEVQLLSKINQILNTGFSSMQQILSSVDSKLDTTNNWLSDLWNTLTYGFTNVKSWLSSGFQSVVDKLDELVTGGSAGDKVSSGGNKIEQSSGSLSDNMDQIQDFEDQQFGNLDAGLGTVIAGGDVSYLVAPLGFIHTYTNKIVAAIPSSYLVVFTLPMLFGVFMFIVGHPIRAPQPDTSGDQVTRETFTTTTVLDGKHKGSTTTTRTVTTSQEIGRRHIE